MKCPIDQNLLTIASREGIEIDYCPSCRGVWLDRGELDKLIERSERPLEQPSGSSSYQQNQSFDENEYDSRDKDHYKKKRKSSLLGELFDF